MPDETPTAPYRLPQPDQSPDLTAWSACALSTAIQARKVSCREVMQAYLQRIARCNPHSQALVSLIDPDQALQAADGHDALLDQQAPLGWMHGLPQAIKDLANVAGLPTTLGSPLMRDFVAAEDGLMTSRMKSAGALVIGKSNTPEFGLGSHTFNSVFGPTRNAWNPTRSAGGSSGGAAVALAQRLLPVADGSDFMGSLRNPAGWNHVFGLRPSQGRVPMWPAQDVWISQLGTEGPMARHVRDLARLLSIQAGYDAAQPLSLSEPASQFAAPLESNPRGLRIGWLGDLQGYLPTEPGVLDVCEQALARFRGMGCEIEDAALGMPPEQVWQAWLVWRQALVGPRIAPFLLKPANREHIKPEALWEYDQSLTLTGAQLLAASATRSRLYQQMQKLFERFDVLALPVAQVWPFDVQQRWPQQIAGHPMDTYHRWMEVVIYATLAGLPAISVPAGFGAPQPDAHGNIAVSDTAQPDWLPMGLQLLGRPRGDWPLLQLAHAYEQASADLLAWRV